MLQIFEKFLTANLSTQVGLIVLAIALWIITAKLFGGHGHDHGPGKSKAEVEKEMDKSSAKVKVRIQWCGG